MPRLTRLHQTSLEGQPGLPGRTPDPGCNRVFISCALETDRFPHAGVSKVRLSRTAVPVSHSLGGGAEHAHGILLRNRILGPGAMSNQMPRGSGHNVYACRWCSSISHTRQRHKGVTCLLRRALMAPVSQQAHRVRPIVFSSLHWSVFFMMSICFSRMPSYALLQMSRPILRVIFFAYVWIALNAHLCREYSTDNNNSGPETSVSSCRVRRLAGRYRFVTL